MYNVVMHRSVVEYRLSMREDMHSEKEGSVKYTSIAGRVLPYIECA
jgi:hypothetical protein